MVREVLAALSVRSDGTYIDCTVGEGGHAAALLGSVRPTPKVVGIDLDTAALETARERLEAYGDRVTLHHGNFDDLEGLASRSGALGADGILFDLGMSSMQIETADRGFSFSRTGRLDMRFDLTQERTAFGLVNHLPEAQLAEIIRRLGEEPRARRIARSIVHARLVKTTLELVDATRRAVGRPSRGGIHPATRTFQALRMAVNRELENIREGLEQAIRVLTSGGRLVAISYHSLEDRLVKDTLRREASGCICPPALPECVCGHEATIKTVTRRVARPSPDEVRTNPRSRSARMRVVERL